MHCTRTILPRLFARHWGSERDLCLLEGGGDRATDCSVGMKSPLFECGFTRLSGILLYVIIHMFTDRFPIAHFILLRKMIHVR